MTRRLPALVAFLLLGCDDQGIAPALYEVGDPCHTRVDTECIDDDVIQHCVERTWARTSCAEACRTEHPSASGGACITSLSTGIDACECTYQDPMGCVPGDLACSEDDASILRCDADQQWVVHPCVEVCGTLASVGCRPEQESGVGQEHAAACLCGG